MLVEVRKVSLYKNIRIYFQLIICAHIIVDKIMYLLMYLLKSLNLHVYNI